MDITNTHTVYDSERKRWENKKEGKRKPLSSRFTKDAAQEGGRAIAKQEEVEHFIHNKNGRIGEHNSYEPDPFPPRG
ncbi:MAG: DUF2188 domain-containing protein [bacterium]